MDRVIGVFQTIEGQSLSVMILLVGLLSTGAVPQDLVDEFKGGVVACLGIIVQRLIAKSSTGSVPFQPSKPAPPAP